MGKNESKAMPDKGGVVKYQPSDLDWLNRQDLCAYMRISPSSLKRIISNNRDFPKPFKASAGARVFLWNRRQISEWIFSKTKEQESVEDL